jgi:peptide/nickel transport system substrate-binding protein
VVGLSSAGSGPDPYQSLYLNYGCGSELNYNSYCNPQVDPLIDSQSTQADQAKRKRLIWEIERELAQDGTRPIIFYDRRAICWQPQVKGLTIMVNSIFSGDVWLDQCRLRNADRNGAIKRRQNPVVLVG